MTIVRDRHSGRTRAAWPAAILALAMTAVGCTEATLQEDRSSSTVTTTPSAVIVDPTVGNPGPITSGNSPLEGMQGARAGVRVTAAFRDRVRSVDNQVSDVAAAARAYDAVTMIAIATEAGRSDRPGRIAENLIDVSGNGRSCLTFVRCRALALDNVDLDYEGLSGGIDLLANGDPGEAEFSIVRYDGTGGLEAVDAVTVRADALDASVRGADPTFGPPGDGVLVIGSLLPVAGPDGAAARAALIGAQLAVDDVNDRGGVLGDPMALLADQSGDGSAESTTAAADQLVAQGVDAVLGGTTYAVTAAAIGPLTDAGIVMVSPTDSARALSVAPDRGLFFRMAPTSDLEGRVLGGLVTDDGYTRVAVVSGTDDESRDLATDVAGALNAEQATVTATISMGPDDEAASIAQAVAADDAQAVVIAASDSTAADLIKALIVIGKGPASFATYGTAENMTPQLATLLGG